MSQQGKSRAAAPARVSYWLLAVADAREGFAQLITLPAGRFGGPVLKTGTLRRRPGLPLFF